MSTIKNLNPHLRITNDAMSFVSLTRLYVIPTMIFNSSFYYLFKRLFELLPLTFDPRPEDASWLQLRLKQSTTEQ